MTYAEKLKKLLTLEPDWDSYGGSAIQPGAVLNAECLLHLINEHMQNTVWVVPTSEGGVQLEWLEGDRGLEIEFRDAYRIEYLMCPSGDYDTWHEGTIGFGEAVQMVKNF